MIIHVHSTKNGRKYMPGYLTKTELVSHSREGAGSHADIDDSFNTAAYRLPLSPGSSTCVFIKHSCGRCSINICQAGERMNETPAERLGLPFLKSALRSTFAGHYPR